MLDEGARLAELIGNSVAGAPKDRLLAEAIQLRAHSSSIRRMIEERIVAPIEPAA